MRLYRVYVQDPDEGCIVAWSGSMTEAKKMLQEMKHDAKCNAGEDDDYEPEPSGIVLEEVPTDKQGLIRWLNANLNRDNG